MSHPTLNDTVLRLFEISRDEILAMFASKLESIVSERARLEAELTPAILGREEEIIRQTIAVLADIEQKNVFLRDHLKQFDRRDVSAYEAMDIRDSLKPVSVDLRALHFAKDPKVDLTTQLYSNLNRAPRW